MYISPWKYRTTYFNLLNRIYLSYDTTDSKCMLLTHQFCLNSDSKTEPKYSFSLNMQTHDLTCPLINERVIVSILGWQIPIQSQSSLPCQKWTPQKVRVAFSMPVHATRVRIGSLSANHGSFIAKPGSCHVHSTLRVTPPTSPCLTLSPHTEPVCQHAVTIFSAQCTVWCSQRGNTELPRYQSGLPASAFLIVIVRTLCDCWYCICRAINYTECT